MVKLGTDCALHRHRSGVPLEVHHVWPRGQGGPDIPANRERVCADGHGEVHGYLTELEAHAGRPPWRTRLRFGWRVRRMARLGYARAQAGSMTP